MARLVTGRRRATGKSGRRRSTRAAVLSGSVHQTLRAALAHSAAAVYRDPAAAVARGEQAVHGGQDPVGLGALPELIKGDALHPIATWITPRNSRKVQMLGTSTGRHTSGLIPSSPTLTCTISATSASAADDAVSTTGLVRFGARVTRSAYRRSPLPVAGTPDILMLTYLARIERLSILLHLGLGWYQAGAPLTALVQNSKPAQ